MSDAFVSVAKDSYCKGAWGVFHGFVVLYTLAFYLLHRFYLQFIAC